MYGTLFNSKVHLTQCLNDDTIWYKDQGHVLDMALKSMVPHSSNYRTRHVEWCWRAWHEAEISQSQVVGEVLNRHLSVLTSDRYAWVCVHQAHTY